MKGWSGYNKKRKERPEVTVVAVKWAVPVVLSAMALFIAFAFGNFVFEIASNVILSPTVVRLLDIREKQK